MLEGATTNFFIKLSGVTLLNKIIQVSSVHFYDTSCVYYIVCLPPEVNLLSSLYV